MVLGVFLLVLVALSSTANSQFIPGTVCLQPTVTPTTSTSCGCSPGQQFLSSPGSVGTNFRSPSLTKSRPLFDADTLLGSQCGCESPCQQFLTPSGPCGSSLRQETLCNTGPQFEPVTLGLGPFNNECGCSSSASQLKGPLAPTLRQSGCSKCETSVSSLGLFGSDRGCCTSSSQFLGPAGPFSIPSSGSVTQCETCASNLGTFSSGCGTLTTKLNVPSLISNSPGCGINNLPGPFNPSFIPNVPKCELNNFVGPITNQITETITTQFPSNKFVSETFISQKPCQSSFRQIELPSLTKIGQCNGIRNIPVTTCDSPVIETCTTIDDDDDECISNTLANALQLLIVSNLIENLNEAAALGTLNSPCASEIFNLGTGTVIESGCGCTDIVTPIKPIGTGCSNSPSFNSLSSIGSSGSSRLGSCNNRFNEFVSPITVPPLGTIEGVPEIINSKVSFGAPNIPDVINPFNLRLTEALKSRLPFGPFTSCGRDIANKINPISIPSCLQPSVLPEIGNPVNLPSFGALFPNKAEVNPFNVQSYSPLAPSPATALNIPCVPNSLNYNNHFNRPQLPDAFGYNQFSGPLLPEVYNYNQFNGPHLPDSFGNNQFSGPLLPETYNYNQFNEPQVPEEYNYNQFNAPKLPEAYNYNQFYGPQSNPLMALLEQLLAEKMNQYTPYGSTETYNPYASFGPNTEQSNSYNSYGFSEIGSGSQVSEVVSQLDAFSSQTPYGTSYGTVPVTLSLGSSPYVGYSEIPSPILPSSSYKNYGFPDISSSAYSNAFTSNPTPPNSYSHPEIMYVPIDIPGIPVTLTGTLPDTSFLTPDNSCSDVVDIPAQFAFEPMVAELLIPSAIPAQITVSI